jgi:hypothetical protein
MSLKDKAHSAVSWSLVQEIAQRVVQFVIGILLARSKRGDAVELSLLGGWLLIGFVTSNLAVDAAGS